MSVGCRVVSVRNAGKWQRGFAVIVSRERRGLDKSLILQSNEKR